MHPSRLAALSFSMFGLAIAAACSSSGNDGGGTSPAPSGPAAPSASAPDAPVTPQTTPPGGGDAGGSSSSSGGNGAPPETPVPYVHFDINHVISTGQSNSVAHGAVPPLTETQPFTNMMFDVGVMTSGVCEQQGCRVYQKPSSFVPLTEGDTFWYPVETMSSGLANEGSMLAKTKYGKPAHDVLISLAGRNGLTYWCLRKGSCTYVDPTYVIAYDENMKQVADGKAIATAAGKSYVVRALTAIHGESDDFGYAVGTPEFPLDSSAGVSKGLKSYADALIEWQRDEEAGVQAITGQSQPIPLFISQFSGWNDIPTSSVSMMQWDAHQRALGKVVIVTPGYMMEFASDCRHYTNHSERKLGEYFGKAYARTVVAGLRWEPLRPTGVTHAGTVVTAKFVVPVPPLVIDTQRVTDPGHYGFEAVDGAGTPIPISKVELAGPDTVNVTLAVAPAAGARLRYAYTTTPHTCVGVNAGPRGNLRDSDTTPSNYGYELFNWSVHFEMPIQ